MIERLVRGVTFRDCNNLVLINNCLNNINSIL